MPLPGKGLHPSEAVFPGAGTPVDTIIFEGPSDSRRTTATFIFGANPEEPGTVFEYRLNGSEWTPCTSPLTIADVPPGNNLVEILATTEEGAPEESPAEWRWQVQGQRILGPAARELLNLLPSWAQTEPLYQGICAAWGNERERLLTKVEEARDAAIPSRMVPLALAIWETMVKLPRNPPGKTVAERWEAVIARLRRIIEDPSGTAWVTRVTEQIGSGWTYLEEAPNILNVKVPFAPATDAYIAGERVLLAEIPAAWELVYGSEEGFILDVSKLDKEQFHHD